MCREKKANLGRTRIANQGSQSPDSMVCTACWGSAGETAAVRRETVSNFRPRKLSPLIVPFFVVKQNTMTFERKQILNFYIMLFLLEITQKESRNAQLRDSSDYYVETGLTVGSC